MSVRLRLSFVVLIGLLAACTAVESLNGSRSSTTAAPDSTTTQAAPEGTLAPTTTDAPDRSTSSAAPLIDPSDDPVTGLLAVIRAGGGLDLVQPDGVLATTLVAEGDGPAGQPTWSPGGDRIAWVAPSPDIGGGRPVVSVADIEGAVVATIAAPFVPFYLSWSPDARWLAALGNVGPEVGLAYLDVEGERSTRVVATGQSLYLSWDPASSGTVIHAGEEWGYTTPLDDGTSFGFLEPAFAAPVWVDDPSSAIVPTGTDGSFNLSGHAVDPSLDGVLDTEAMVPLASYAGRIWVVADPTWRRLAVLTRPDDSPVVGGGSSLQVSFSPASFRAQTEPPNLELGVSVFDRQTGTVAPIGDSDDLTAGMFWDPTGEILARLDVDPPDAEGPLAWELWSTSGALRSLPGFTPTQLFATAYLPFFDQYAQSVSFFSPSGRVFAYTAFDEDESTSFVNIVDLTATEPTPQRLTEGVLAVWSS